MSTPGMPLLFRRDPDRPLDPPAELLDSRARRPLDLVDTPLIRGQAWMFSRYDDVREVLGDSRLSSCTNPKFGEGNLLNLDDPEHSRLRRMLTAQFSVRRLRDLEPLIESLVEDCLRDMESQRAAGQDAVDLVSSFALPIPSTVISHMLGVPAADHAMFQQLSNTLLRLDLAVEVRDEAYLQMFTYTEELVQRHRKEPGEDLLSGLVVNHGEELTDSQIAGMGVLLLIAGHETTANMLSLGTLALLQHPEQLATMRGGEAQVRAGVEELLRYLSVVSTTTPRTAAVGFQAHGHAIAPGDAVRLSLLAANRDPGFIEDPDRMDLHRKPTPHVAFGFGVHQCLGQQLARQEMRIAFPALLRRFPDLALAIDPAEIQYRDQTFIYGLWSLPVTW